MMLFTDWPAGPALSIPRLRTNGGTRSGFRCVFLAALLCLMAGETAFADIIHMCLDGVYYQVSPGQGKYLKMGTCGANNWTYRERTDVLLFTAPPTPGTVQADAQSVISRGRGVAGVAIPESALTSRSYQNVTNLIPETADEPTERVLQFSSPGPASRERNRAEVGLIVLASRRPCVTCCAVRTGPRHRSS